MWTILCQLFSLSQDLLLVPYLVVKNWVWLHYLIRHPTFTNKYTAKTSSFSSYSSTTASSCSSYSSITASSCSSFSSTTTYISSSSSSWRTWKELQEMANDMRTWHGLIDIWVDWIRGWMTYGFIDVCFIGDTRTIIKDILYLIWTCEIQTTGSNPSQIWSTWCVFSIFLLFQAAALGVCILWEVIF